MGWSMAELHPHQVQGVADILQAPRKRFILNWEMGCGKTPPTIAALARLPGKTLIVAPAIARQTWMYELQRWWPGSPEVGLIQYGKARGLSAKKAAENVAAYSSLVQVVSYELLAEVDRTGWNWIVLDEIHRLQSASSKAGKVAREITHANPCAGIVGLSATLMPDTITNAWHPLHCIWPRRFGAMDRNGRGSWEFACRYSNPTYNGYGYRFEGVNATYVDELRHRLTQVSSRVTRADIAHLLPAFDVQVLREEAGADKRKVALEWAELAGSGASHICLLTHLRETAEELAKALGGTCITGEMPIEKRHQTLTQLRKRPRAILCATMHALNENVDLTFLTQALFVELSYRPKDIIQALGRFSRLSGSLPSSVQLLVRARTADELIASKVQSKLESINAAVRAGGAESVLETAFGDPRSEEQFAASLRDAANSSGWDLSEYGL